MSDGTGTISSGILEVVLNLLNELITAINGHGQSILSNIYDNTVQVSEQVSSLGDNLAYDTRTISDQVESSRSMLASHITLATDDINAHSDENTSQIIASVNQSVNGVNSKLDVIEATLANLGSEIGNAIANSIKDIVASITQSEADLVSKVEQGLNRLDQDVTDAIDRQAQVFAQAINNAAGSIDNLSTVTKEVGTLLKDELESIRITLSDSLQRHADELDKAIRESASGISTAIGTETAATLTIGTELSGAILEGAAIIAESIAASQLANKAMLAGKIAKDIEVADLVISILTALATIVTLDSPEAVAALLTPIIESYYNIGKAVTNDTKLT